MRRIRLVHWNAAEAKERAAKLKAAGYSVRCEVPGGPTALREMARNPPSAVVIDLSRLPMQGRDVAFGLRAAKATRRVPLVFVEGDPAKVERVKQGLPDAVYTGWGDLSSLKRAIASPPENPVVPSSSLAGYSGTPLLRKLGIKAHTVVTLIGAPRGFENTLGDLPEGVILRRRARGRCDLAVWFTRSRRDLVRRVDEMGQLADRGLWIAWPKKASGVATDLTQTDVRRLGLAAGLVDYKIAAIDSTWSGLKFTRRKPR